jgi:hypothetical protein
MFRPSVVRSITISAARALIVIGPNRRSLARMENCVVRSPLGARRVASPHEPRQFRSLFADRLVRFYGRQRNPVTEISS